MSKNQAFQARVGRKYVVLLVRGVRGGRLGWTLPEF
jgi:hypothetical protein